LRGWCGVRSWWAGGAVYFGKELPKWSVWVFGAFKPVRVEDVQKCLVGS
jgi:hypothetical protein